MKPASDKVFDIVAQCLRTSLEDLSGQKASIIPETPIFGRQSPLDSIQLVSLIVDIEEATHDAFGIEVVLADQRAMSQKQSPFRDVAALCTYIELLLSESSHGS